MLHVLERLSRHAADRPDAEAFRELDDAGRCAAALTYGQFAAAVSATAHRLRTTLDGQPTVIISHPNGLDYAVAFFGVLAAGGTAFPVHPRLARSERVAAAGQSGATAFFAEDSAVADFEALGLHRLRREGAKGEKGEKGAKGAKGEKGAKGDVGILLESSGTTGPPSIVRRSGPSLDAVARNVAESLRLTPNDRVLGLIPSCHAYGVEHTMLAPVWAGCCVHLCRSVDVLRAPAGGRGPGFTILPGVPTLFEFLATALGSASIADSPLRHVRRAYSAGAALPASVFDAFRGAYGVRIGQFFGMTEVGSVTFNDPDEDDHDPMSVGLPLSGVSIRVVDVQARRLDRPCAVGVEGEVAVSGPSMLTGYLRDEGRRCEPPAGMDDGYFLTGDLGRLDPRGRLTITGRLKLVVDVGGLKVNLLEVERAVCDHEAVRECVVVPVSVSETVVRLKAYVLPRENGSISTDALRAFLRSRLSAHKIPRTFEVRESFPRSATGKILRHRL